MPQTGARPKFRAASRVHTITVLLLLLIGRSQAWGIFPNTIAETSADSTSASASSTSSPTDLRPGNEDANATVPANETHELGGTPLARLQQGLTGSQAQRSWEGASEEGGSPASDAHVVQGRLGRPKSLTPPDFCASELKIPKVAMLFLTRGVMHHEKTWTLWFKSVAGVVPLQQMQNAGCSRKTVNFVYQHCGWNNSRRILENQHLFNVYIHVPLDFQGFNESNLFYGRDLPTSMRVMVSWGSHSLVDAQRSLFRAALEDPLNQKFIMLSESGIPLYPATTTYMQLITEEKSRINACGNWPTDERRWSTRMETTQLKGKHWRKSSQWVALTRSHVELVVQESHVNQQFATYCKDDYDPDIDKWRDCFSDEHYIPTLLAFLDKEHETDCWGFLVHVDWRRGGPHPREYSSNDISPAKLRLLRMPTNSCGYPAAIKTAPSQFIKAASVKKQACEAPIPAYARTLGYQCPLFARKFPKDTAPLILELMQDCKNRLRIVNEEQCESEVAHRLRLL